MSGDRVDEAAVTRVLAQMEARCPGSGASPAAPHVTERVPSHYRQTAPASSKPTAPPVSP